MKKFIKKIFLFLVPMILIALLMEFLLRNIPNDYKYKKDYLINNSNRINKLFLGSSHTYYGINPSVISGNSFNASHVSQSIDLDLQIIKKYRNNWKGLEYIIIPIDYFTLFFRLSNSVESWRLKNYNLYYDFQLSNKLSDNTELISNNLNLNISKIISFYLQNEKFITCSELGYANKFKENKDLVKSGIEAGIRHTVEDFSNLDESINILNEMISFAKKNDIEIIFYTSPAYYTYVSNLNVNQLELTIKTITKIADNNDIAYFNLLEDSSFNSSDYRDADHLNQKGAKKLSLKIDDMILNSKILKVNASP